MGEFRAEKAHELVVDVAETGESRGTHSGGEVVLRCTVGLEGLG